MVALAFRSDPGWKMRETGFVWREAPTNPVSRSISPPRVGEGPGVGQEVATLQKPWKKR
jgi:hypothetical protein